MHFLQRCGEFCSASSIEAAVIFFSTRGVINGQSSMDDVPNWLFAVATCRDGQYFKYKMLFCNLYFIAMMKMPLYFVSKYFRVLYFENTVRYFLSNTVMTIVQLSTKYVYLWHPHMVKPL